MKKVNWQYLIDTLLFISIAGVVIIGLLLAFVIPKGPSATDSAKYFLGLHRHEWGNIHLYLGIAFTMLAVVHLVLGWNWIKGKTRGMFGDRWKAGLLSMCSLPFLVLAVSWLAFPREPSVYDHNETGAAPLDRGVLEAGQFPPYNPSNATRTTPADAERPGSMNKQPSAMALESGSNTKKEEESALVHHRSEEEAGLTRGRGSEDTSGILITGQTTLRDIEKQTGISSQVLAAHLGLPRNVSPDDRLGRLRKSYPVTMQDVRAAISSLLEQ